MKKIFTLAIIALMGIVGMQAQTVTVTKNDGSVITYRADEIKDIQFHPAATVPDTVVVHEFTGYLTVSSKFFQDMYYGDSARIKVMQVDGAYLARFEDAQWGTGLFNITMGAGGAINGTGKLTIKNPHAGTSNDYDATLSGKMTEITITASTLMQGTTITWHYGTATEAVRLAGSYTGTDSVNVGGSFPYTSAEKVTYQVTSNADGTINLIVPQVKYNGTVMGDLTLGTYTIGNIAYDAETKTFTKAYKDDNIKFHFTAANNGQTTMDKEYTFDKDVCKVTVSMNDKGQLVVSNTFQMGAMPFTIFGAFTGTKR